MPSPMEGQSSDHGLMERCAREAVETTSPRDETSTWSFVQMNMTLLPIARPRPVSIGHKGQEGAALSGVKPCTPTQKLHHRLRQHTSNISPRRHDLTCSNARPVAPTYSHSTRGLPPTPRSTKRKMAETWHASSSDTMVGPSAASASFRLRSLSEDSYPAAACSDCGYASDTARQRASGCSSLHRSVSRSSGCAAKRLYKGKRILELQDEDRRLHPDDRGAALSQSKRSKQ